MSTCPTVKVVSKDAPGGFVIINESDRKPHHEIWTGTQAKPSPQAPQTTAGVFKEAQATEATGKPASPSLNLGQQPGGRKSR